MMRPISFFKTFSAFSSFMTRRSMRIGSLLR
ncbi:hypothetical protein RO1_36290 [Roseburia intestinalis XB6B4]|uniref:Uncharacterized protein n=1 Tax=Roseburia intestinalis XB6B4 TaxID=718255 RepID=D4L2P0_9FIRM|nr:hypothetical protein RO1_36290 [Roseburia intestinalis XB6B4]